MYSRAKIVVHNLSKSFGSKNVLNKINLEVRDSESLVIIGGSGSGKSVLLKSILGLIEPDEGAQVIINGEDLTYTHISKRKAFISKFGMLFQGGALFDGLPIWQNIAFSPIMNKKMTKREARAFASSKLEMVGLGAEIIDLYPAEISGGMQKRVALARAIAPEPEVIFFDEPTAGLDPITASVISNLIRRLSKELNATTITITHDIKCMYTVADSVAMLCAGNVAWHGPLKEISNAQNENIKQFISSAAY